jgi:phosphoadenosine phosphosulfate reductase
MLERLDRDLLEREAREALASGLEKDPPQILKFAHGLLGERLMMSTAFGKTGMVILHMVQELGLDIPVYFIDTGFHFQETMDYIGTLEQKWGITIQLQRPKVYGDEFKARFGEKLYESNPDLCCHKNKVEPFGELLDNYQGWITGIRRDQSPTRAHAEGLEVLETNQLKVQPLVLWTHKDCDAYLEKHSVPLHPLFAEGYPSIGCAPCTHPSSDPNNERSGRWAGKGKTECGLHLFRKKTSPEDEEGDDENEEDSDAESSAEDTPPEKAELDAKESTSSPSESGTKNEDDEPTGPVATRA